MKNIHKILIVCTGNSCRSIMAEGYLVKRLRDIGRDGIFVISSGTAAYPGLRPTGETIETVKEEGVDVSGYTSLNLNRAHVENADVILVMEPRHKETVLRMMPEAKDKTYLLRNFSSKDKTKDSIADPIGRPIEFYREVFKIIKDSIEGFVKWLEE